MVLCNEFQTLNGAKRAQKGESENFQTTSEYPDNPFFTISIGTGPAKVLSVMFWYMDPNRPLPPGKIFDPYRKRDFERRRAEGFPLPKIDSRIKTPEATPEQQKERDQFWPKGLGGRMPKRKTER